MQAADDQDHIIDVHAFIFDDHGNIVDGVMYPAESLKGVGQIAGHLVKCISPQFMVEFLAPWVYKWPNQYLPAIEGLCEKFGIAFPQEYVQFVTQLRNKK